MKVFQRLFGHKDSKKEATTSGPEHAIILTMDLSNDSRGSEEEMKLVHAFTDRLDEALTKDHVGEYDGDEFGGGEVTLYIYGPDADAALSVIKPILEESPIKPIRVLQRYGSADDKAAKEKHSRIL